MNPNTLRIFELCNELATLLSDKQAIADLQVLLDRHPEMFRDIAEVASTIDEVVKKPEIIVDATHSNKDTGIFKVAKRLDSQKMGDIVVKNNNGTNEIFHANKKNVKEFDRLYRQVKAGGRCAHFLHPDLENQLGLVQKAHSPAKEIIVDGRDAHTPYTQAQSLDGRLVDSNISSTTDSNSTKESNQSQTKPKIRRKQ